MRLSIEHKIGQMFFVGIPGAEIDQKTKLLLEGISPGGICLFARNCKDASDIRNILDEIREISVAEPFLSIDQEGGLVDRLRRVSEPMPSAADISALGSVELIERFARISAELLRILGFNMNFAPVLDVISKARLGNDNGALGTRAFGRSPEDVINMAGAYADALYDGGIMPCHKHFPGIGGIEVDAHDDLPAVNLTREELFEMDFVPYVEMVRSQSIFAVMTGHVVFPEFDLQERDSDGKLLPTSLSRNIVTKLLRGEFGFDGLALTDDLEMGAIINHYGIAQAAIMSVKAGNDFILICNNPDMIYQAHEAVLEAVESGEISEERIEESYNRIEQARTKLKAPISFDLERIEELSRGIKEIKKEIELYK